MAGGIDNCWTALVCKSDIVYVLMDGDDAKNIPFVQHIRSRIIDVDHLRAKMQFQSEKRPLKYSDSKFCVVGCQNGGELEVRGFLTLPNQTQLGLRQSEHITFTFQCELWVSARIHTNQMANGTSFFLIFSIVNLMIEITFGRCGNEKNVTCNRPGFLSQKKEPKRRWETCSNETFELMFLDT